MESLSDKERMELLGEVFMDKLRVIREYVSDIPVIKRRVGSIEERLDKVEWRLENVEHAIRDHSKILQGHGRIIRDQSKDIANLQQQLT